MDARRIARELLDLTRGVSENDRAYELEVWDESDWSPLPPEDAQQHNISRYAGRMVVSLR